MKTLTSQKSLSKTRIFLAVAATLSASSAFADAVTDWNLYTTLATKGATSPASGDNTNALNSNVATRIDAIAARAVFDAVNAINHFSDKSYYYSSTPSTTPTTNLASAAAAQAAHDVLVGKETQPGTLPNNNASWTDTRTWLDNQLAADLNALGVNGSDPVYQ